MEKSLIPKVFSEVQRNSFMNDLFRDQLLEYYERVCKHNLISIEIF